MALQYSPKISTEGLVLCLDPGNNKSFPSYTLPVKGGLIMWMDASDDSTFSYSSGTTVSQWRDKSGSGYHMVPISAGPTRNSFLNSRKTLTFTTSQDIQNLSIDLRTSAYTIFVVSRLTGTTNQRVLTANPGNAGSNWLLGHWGGLVNPYYAEGWVYYSPNSADTVWRIYMGDWSGTTTDLANAYSNGTSLATNSTVASGGPYSLGINAHSGERSTCEAAEIITFNRTLSIKEIKQIHTYLGLKWGISNTDRTIHDLIFNNDSKLGEGTSANMPRFDYYNGGALAFDGVNDYFYVNDGSGVPYFTPDGSTVSVNLWFKPATINTGASNKMIFSDNCSPEFSLHQVDNTVYAYSYYGVSATIQANKWYNACWTSNAGAANVTSSTTTVTFYLDGQLVGTNSGATGNGLNDLPFTLGKDPCVAGTNWSGSLGPLYFYNRIITSKEVKQNYEALKPRFFDTIVQSGLIVNLDAGNPYSYSGTGSLVYDVSGNGNDFTIQGNVSWDKNSGFGNFDGNSTGSGNKIYRSSFPQNLKTSQGGNGYTVFVVARSTYAGSWRKLIGNGDSENYIDLYQHSTSYTWHQDGSGDTMYVDGVQVSNDTYVMYNAGFHCYAATNLNNGSLTNPTYALSIGNEPNSSPNGTNAYPWIGNVAVVLLYNRVLTAAELLQNYNALKGRFGI